MSLQVAKSDGHAQIRQCIRQSRIMITAQCVMTTAVIGNSYLSTHKLPGDQWILRDIVVGVLMVSSIAIMFYALRRVRACSRLPAVIAWRRSTEELKRNLVLISWLAGMACIWLIGLGTIASASETPLDLALPLTLAVFLTFLALLFFELVIPRKLPA